MNENDIERALKALAVQAPQAPSALTNQTIEKLRLLLQKQAERCRADSAETAKKNVKPPEKKRNHTK